MYVHVNTRTLFGQDVSRIVGQSRVMTVATAGVEADISRVMLVEVRVQDETQAFLRCRRMQLKSCEA